MREIECRDLLEENTEMKFDVIVGNPPYQAPRNNVSYSGKKTSSAGGISQLWPRFFFLSLDILRDGGYLSLIHPNTWRKPFDKYKIKDEFSKQNCIYLSMNSLSEGSKVFNASTSFDWYVLQKAAYSGKTIVNDFYGAEYTKNINELQFIPNAYNEIFTKIFSKEINNYVYNTSFHHVKSTGSGSIKSFYSVGSDGSIRSFFFEDNDENSKAIAIHKIPKIIIQLTGHKLHVYNDYNAEFVCGEFACGIPISSKEEGEIIINWMTGNESMFNETLMWGMTREHRLFGLLNIHNILREIENESL